MKKERNTKGITLIALVVTIIVLIILAVIGINSAIGENGLIKQAEETKSGQEERMATDGERMSRLADGYANEVAERSKTETRAKEVAKSPETYYGKTVNYSANGINDWKIFYSNGTNIFLITSEYLQNNKVPTETEATNTKPYQASWASGGEPTTLDTANRQDELFMATGYTLNGDNANSKCVSKLLNTDIWKNFAEGTKAKYAIGSPTIEMWVASWNARYPLDKIKCQPSASERSSEGYGYKVDLETGNYTDGIIEKGEMNTKSGYDNPLYYPHKEMLQQCWGYWLASTSAGNPSGAGNRILLIDREGGISDQLHWHTAYGVRPVVCLSPDIYLSSSESDYDFDMN